MKRNLQLRILASAAAVVASYATAFGQIRVEVDGNLVHFNDTQPRMIDGRVLVPLRGVLEHMGATVFWDPSRRLVTARQGQRDISLYIGQRSAQVDGRTVSLDVPAMIVGGSTMVPLRFMSESLGAEVMWLSSSRTVRIETALDVRDPAPPLPPRVADIDTFEVEAPRNVLRAGDEIRLTLKGTPGANVTFSIPNVIEPRRMREQSAGLYVANWTVPTRANGLRFSQIVAQMTINGTTRRMRAG